MTEPRPQVLIIEDEPLIAMDIEEEVSTIIAGLITNADTANTSPGPTTRINRTTTRVHIPDGYFLIISGMMQNEVSRDRNQVPCLGGVPIVGAAFSDKTNLDQRRNLMIFIRPQIVDTEEEIQNITKHQQDLYRYGNCFKNSDEYETVEALDLLNITKTLHPEDEYECDCDCVGQCDQGGRRVSLQGHPIWRRPLRREGRRHHDCDRPREHWWCT